VSTTEAEGEEERFTDKLKSNSGKVLMEVWFPRREYAVRQAPQGHSYDRSCRHENDPGQSLIGKLRCA